VTEFYHLQQAGGVNLAENWLVNGAEHARSFQNYPMNIPGELWLFLTGN